MAKRFFAQELLLSSSDSSSDNDLEPRGPMTPRPRVEDYVGTTVDRFSDEEFKENFRVNRSSFNQVLERIREDIESSQDYTGHHTIPGRVQLLMALWHYATPDTYRSVCNRFNIGRATGLRIVRKVANALLKQSPGVIKWPDQVNEVVQGFQNKGFPNTMGAIDGTHIQIPKPKGHGASYINRHNNSSVILQAVCDHNLKFIHCYAGEVGSSHDARVLKKSDLWEKIIQQDNTYFPNDTHLVGDKAYPCLPRLQVPYKDNGHLTPAQRNYNYKLSSTRVVIERAFAMLKGRFRCLYYMDITSIEWAPKYIIACCVLHNICIMNNDYFDVPEDIPEINIDNEQYQGHEGNILMPVRQLVQLGHAKRNNICAQLFNFQEQ